MNHVRFMISPELDLVQDEVQGLALHPNFYPIVASSILPFHRLINISFNPA